MSRVETLLLVEDSISLAHIYKGYLQKEPYEIVHVETGQAAIDSLNDNEPSVVVLDMKLPDMDGIEVLKTLNERKINASVIVVTAYGSINVAVDAMREGAYDFIVKPFSAERLVQTVRNAKEHAHLTEVVETYRQKIDRPQFESIIGSSLPMQAIYRTLESAAPTDATIFITGETGTGKELCAEAVHRQSSRADKPFVVINCAAIPKDLIESEIFGHIKGAFTGATSGRDGAATIAHGGTLFLDELCEMELPLQSKLLRFIQSGTFQRVGSSKTEKVDVRFICATNRDPWQEVEEGRFREDLYYRLHVIPVAMPPLRDRGDDITEIARAFLTRFAEQDNKAFKDFDADTIEKLLTYPWVGNIRELQNAVRQIVVLHDGEFVTPQMLADHIRDGRPNPATSSSRPVHARSNVQPATNAPASERSHQAHQSSDLGGATVQPTSASTELRPQLEPQLKPQLKPMALVEREMIDEALRRTNGNVPRAAAMLEISPSSVYRKKSPSADNYGERHGFEEAAPDDHSDHIQEESVAFS